MKLKASVIQAIRGMEIRNIVDLRSRLLYFGTALVI